MQAKIKAEEVVVVEGAQKWVAPRSLAQLWAALAEARAAGGSFRVVAGNTAAGVYKNWPLEDTVISLLHVQELRTVSLDKVGPPPFALDPLAFPRPWPPSDFL